MNLKLILLLAVAGIAGAMSAPQSAPQASEPIVKFVAEELESYKPATTHDCGCDCPTADEIRSIVREELEAFKTQFAVKYEAPKDYATRPSGSTGGTPPATGGTQGRVVCENGQCRVVSGPVTRTYNTRRFAPIRNLFRR